jgi:hypothetical protein
MNCHICNAVLKDDLFSAVTGDKVCCICKVKFIGGLPTKPARIAAARDALGLKAGEYLAQDNPSEAAKLLGR